MVQDIRTLGLTALLSFRTVVKLGGISAAATQLGMAKSGVSRHISQLEDHFGVQLLERGARSVRVTPVGRKLDNRIRSILAEVELLEDIAREHSDAISGQVTIAATPEFGGVVATSLFPYIQSRHPNLTLVMRPDYAFEDMQDPGTDIAFRVGTFKDDRLVALELGGFERWIVATPDFLAKHKLTSPADLANLPCLTFRGDRPGASWRFFDKDGIEQTVDVSGPIAVRNFEILLSLTIAGQGFANLPNFMLKDELERRSLLRCLTAFSPQKIPVYLTFRPGARNVARIAAVIDAAERIVPGLLNEAN